MADQEEYGSGTLTGIQYSNNLLAYGIGENHYAFTTIKGYKIILQSANVASEGESKAYKDNAGQTTSLVIPERYQTIQCEGLLLKDGASGEMPKKGDEADVTPMPDGAIDGVKWRVESFSVAWANEDVAKVSFQLRSYNF